MKATRRSGLSRVNRDSTIGVMGEEGRVYSTPYSCATSRTPAAICCANIPMPERTRSDGGVGAAYGADIGWHGGANHRIHVGVYGRKITFEVSATDELKSIGAGMH